MYLVCRLLLEKKNLPSFFDVCSCRHMYFYRPCSFPDPVFATGYVLFLVVRPLPHTTLFPYTTLFRSIKCCRTHSSGVSTMYFFLIPSKINTLPFSFFNEG